MGMQRLELVSRLKGRTLLCKSGVPGEAEGPVVTFFWDVGGRLLPGERGVSKSRRDGFQRKEKV